MLFVALSLICPFLSILGFGCEELLWISGQHLGRLFFPFSINVFHFPSVLITIPKKFFHRLLLKDSSQTPHEMNPSLYSQESQLSITLSGTEQFPGLQAALPGLEAHCPLGTTLCDKGSHVRPTNTVLSQVAFPYWLVLCSERLAIGGYLYLPTGFNLG